MAELRSAMDSAAQTSDSEGLSSMNACGRSVLPSAFVMLAGLAATALPSSAETWRGLIVAPEFRCSAYDRDDYPYPRSVEQRIVEQIGGIYGPYSGRCFSSTRETDIEHIVSLSEAHDSGLCAAGTDTKRMFARDLLNLTLASPGLNRRQKSAKDAAQWLPSENRCWFAAHVHAVRLKYGLTIDAKEAAALEAVLSNCEFTELVVRSCDWSGGSEQETVRSATAGGDSGDPLELWDDNRNGRITCKEARRHGIAPVKRGHPAYRYMRDGDGDGWVCE